MSDCKLCDVGFPLNKDGNHIPTQSLGMIPVTRCANAPAQTATQVLQERENERKHLVQSAQFWFRSAHLDSRSHSGSLFAMEQAYNHVEDALAAALRQLAALKAAAEDDVNPLTLPLALEDAKKFLEKFPLFKP